MILNPTRPVWPGFSSSKSLCGDANCMEQLLLHCANAIESNDATLTQQTIWVINNLASSDGDSTQRLASSLLRALISRAATKSPAFSFLSVASASHETLHRFSVIELAVFVDLTPWHRFGFIAANAAILDAVKGYSSVHIVDLSLTHCMQIPTLLDSMATKLINKEQSPPLLKLTVVLSESPPPPLLGISYEELGLKLVSFAATRNVAMEFRIIYSSYSDGLSSLIEQLRLDPLVCNEALVVNCHMMLHYIPNDTLSYSSPSRSLFLKELRDLNPTMVTLIEEDADFTSSNFIARLRSLFNYMWIPYDTADTFLTCGSEQRQWYEADIGWRIDNVVAKEGAERVERLEPKSRWFKRMREADFTGVGFGEAVAREVQTMLEEHAAGWGMKRDVDDSDDVERFVLTWKGHSVVFASAWVPMNRVDGCSHTLTVWPGFSSSKSLCGDANCMEQLLLHCANAIESNDATLTQQTIWVINNLASSDGDSTQRLASSLLRALISRAATKSPAFSFLSVASASHETLHRFSVIELAAFVDLTPWHRFGFIAANAAILDAVKGYSSVHIVDLSLTHCMQIPTLIDSMATKLINKEQSLPLLKLTVVLSESPPPPLLGISYEELGLKLVSFAATRNVAMEFRIIYSSYSDGLSSLIEQLRLDPLACNEALVVNCHMMLHYISHEALSYSSPSRSLFLKELRDLNPTMVTLIEEDADFTSSNFISRFFFGLYYYVALR
ncbi:hypothetical protein F2Q69_00054937 [Brassica cretica]|uniref:Scarecrow-like protein 32 n=1 Tax=Brassica cretica TaxID=69181 RepID=A0A8S9MUM8_BRACR|nr:hypothetical protein F2Q69_00054937 [Brassica cretica]